MPCDTYSNANINDDYETCINCIEGLLMQYSQEDFVISGDWNASFVRDNCQTKTMRDFLDRNELHVTWEHPSAQRANTYVNHNLNHESCIDHIVVSSNVFGNICCSKVIETPLNPPRHCPVILRFSIAYKSMINQSQSATDSTSHKVAWHKVDDKSIGCYKARIDVLIDNLNISLAKMSCTDVLCDSTAYRSDINSLCKQLIDV